MADERNLALVAALKRLNVREYSSAEMIDYLTRKGFEKKEADATVAALMRDRSIDNLRYSRVIVRALAARGKGPTFIRMKLKMKGIDLSTTELRELLFEVSGKPELELARELVERRYPSARRDREAAAKAMQALMRRGFSYDVARQAVGSRYADIER